MSANCCLVYELIPTPSHLKQEAIHLLIEWPMDKAWRVQLMPTDSPEAFLCQGSCGGNISCIGAHVEDQQVRDLRHLSTLAVTDRPHLCIKVFLEEAFTDGRGHTPESVQSSGVCSSL